MSEKIVSRDTETCSCRFKISPATLNWKVYGYFARKLHFKDSVCQDEFNRVHDVQRHLTQWKIWN